MLKTYQPLKILEPYVAFYYTITLTKKDNKSKISEFCLPNGYSHMGFHDQGNIYILQNNRKQAAPKFYTVGQQTHYYYFNSDSDIVALYGAAFTPTGLWHFFGVDMPSITNKAVETTTIVKVKFQKFTEQFNATQDVSSKIKLLEDFLIKRLQAIKPQLNIIDSAIQIINAPQSCCSIKDIINTLGISERYFQKNFKKIVGIPPTVYKRIVRFNYICSEIKKDTPIDCKSLVAHYNYYDFAHFSKDFKSYCGTCPTKFQIAKFNFLQELTASGSLIMKRRNIAL